MKIKRMPSEKIRRRYLLLKNTSKEEVEKAILEYIGILGWAKAKPVFVEHVKETVLAIERSALNDVRAAIELYPADIKIARVSGTLKGLGK